MNRNNPPDDASSPSEDAARYSKRRRVALACDNCRERKVRCDGKKPVCGPCEKRNDGLVDCGYKVLAHSAKRVSEQEYIASLRQQIRDLQRAPGSQPRRSESFVRDNDDDDNDDDDGGLPPLASPSALSFAEPAGQSNAEAAPTHRHLPQCTSLSGPRSGQVLVEDRRSGHRGGQPTLVASSQVETSPPCIADRHGHPEGAESPHRTATGDDHHGPSPISAMGATIPVQDRPSTGRNNEFYGGSSLVSLVREMVQPPSKRGDQGGRPRRIRSPSASTATRDTGRSTTMRPRERAMLQMHFALPPREVADRLLGLYFASVHIFYPWTHSLSFRNEYERLWLPPQQDSDADGRPDIGLGGGGCPRHVFFTALNAMLALGCEFSDVCPEDKEAASAMFFDRMRNLLRLDVLDSGSISHVQALLLVGQYLLCTHYPTQCWNVIGLACRMAVGLGLQLDNSADDVSEAEKQIRYRVWYGCVQMDMTVSMTLGRPPYLHMDEDVPLPLAIDDEYLPLDGQHTAQPEGTYSTSLFTVENIKLAKILGKILGRVYQRYGKAGTSAGSLQDSTLTHDDLNVMLHIDSQLEDCVDSLPRSLRWDTATRSSEDIPPVLKRQSNVLRARFLHMKVLLHRPSFTSFCASAHSQARARRRSPGDRNKTRPRETDLSVTLRTQCALVCVRKTCELVESLRNATTQDATGAWWFNLFYLITSAIILILTECTPLLKSHVGENALSTAWENCLETLKLVSNVHPLAGQYLQSLTQLRQRSLSMSNSLSGLSAPVSPAHSGAPAGASHHPPSGTGRVETEGGGLDHMVSEDLGTGEEAGWQYHSLDGAELDFPSFPDMWESDLNNFMFPSAVTGADGLGYPVSSLF